VILEESKETTLPSLFLISSNMESPVVDSFSRSEKKLLRGLKERAAAHPLWK
jgi:hypothetical protein